MTLKDRILEILPYDPAQALTPQEIGAQLDMNVKTVQKRLRTLESPGWRFIYHEWAVVPRARGASTAKRYWRVE